MFFRIPDVGYVSLISLFEMMALIGQKSQNFKTIILSRAELIMTFIPGREGLTTTYKSGRIGLKLIKNLECLGSRL